MNAYTPSRALPVNLEAEQASKIDMTEGEQAVIGALLMNAEIISEMPDELGGHHFQERVHGEMFEEIKRLQAAGRPVTPITVKSALSVQSINGTSVSVYMARMAASGSLGPNAAVKLAGEIIMSSYRREIARIGAQLAQAAYGHELDFHDEIESLSARIAEIRAEMDGQAGHQTAGDSYLAMFDASAKHDGVVGVPIALPEIGKVLSEKVFEAGNLYGLLSSSGEGKSSLTMQLIYHAVKEGHPVLFLSYDQSAAQCVRQMIAQVHEISVNQQRDPMGKMSDRERDRCVEFATWLNRKPLDVIRCQREGVSQLITYARRFMKKRANGMTPFIVIDHIGKVKPRDPKLSADRISGEVTVELKALADETSSAILVLNQRNGFGTRRDNPRPIAADLYGGEGARADYDAVLYLYRAEKYKAERQKIAASDSDWKKINKVFGTDVEGVAEIGVIKSRFGDPTLTETLKFAARFTRYESNKPQVSQERML